MNDEIEQGDNIRLSIEEWDAIDVAWDKLQQESDDVTGEGSTDIIPYPLVKPSPFRNRKNS